MRARRIERSSRVHVERMKINMQISKGSRNARSRMWLQRMQQKRQEGWQRRSPDNRFRPAFTHARKKGSLEKIQQIFRKRKEVLLKAFGGRK